MKVQGFLRGLVCCQATVRRWLHQFAAQALKSLYHKRRALNGPLPRKQTWMAAQLAETLAHNWRRPWRTRGWVMKPHTVCKYLQLMGARYVSTKCVLRHRQEPAAATRAEPDNLKKACAGKLDLYFLDETGSSPCLLPTHS